MSDAEVAYRRALAKIFSSHPLMCVFHMIKAVREYWFSWAKLAQDEEKALWDKQLHPDLLTLKRSKSLLEVQAKWAAIQKEWVSTGIADATRHQDGNGCVHNIVTYFEKQWLQTSPGWHGGHSCIPLANTNNAVESQVGHTRNDFGNVPGTATQLARFMLEQASFFAKEEWNPVGRRPVDTKLWQRAMEFKKLHHTTKVRAMSAGSVQLYVCWERRSESVADRRSMCARDARIIIDIHCKLGRGEEGGHQGNT